MEPQVNTDEHSKDKDQGKEKGRENKKFFPLFSVSSVPLWLKNKGMSGVVANV